MYTRLTIRKGKLGKWHSQKYIFVDANYFRPWYFEWLIIKNGLRANIHNVCLNEFLQYIDFDRKSLFKEVDWILPPTFVMYQISLLFDAYKMYWMSMSIEKAWDLTMHRSEILMYERNSLNSTRPIKEKTLFFKFMVMVKKMCIKRHSILYQ